MYMFNKSMNKERKHGGIMNRTLARSQRLAPLAIMPPTAPSAARQGQRAAARGKGGELSSYLTPPRKAPTF